MKKLCILSLILLHSLVFAQDDYVSPDIYIVNYVSLEHNAEIEVGPVDALLFYYAFGTDTESQGMLTFCAIDDEMSETLIEEGSRYQDIPFFNSETTYPVNADGGYDTLLIGKKGHHLIWYKDQDNKTVHVMELDYDISIGQLEFTSFKNEAGEELEIKNLKGEYSLFACFDYNHNGTVDEGEYKHFRLIF